MAAGGIHRFGQGRPSYSWNLSGFHFPAEPKEWLQTPHNSLREMLSAQSR